jgi:hypothetical protein
MMSLSVEDYMKRLDQLASMSVGTPGSTTGRQPLRNLSVNNQRAAETEATQKVRAERFIFGEDNKKCTLLQLGGIDT